jgi:arylsulfatase A-like enzyme
VNVLEPAYTDRNRPIFSVLQLTRWQEAVTLNGWKYIYDLTDVQPYLFDIHSDPGETANLAERKPELAQALHAVLSDWHAAQVAYYRPSNRPFRHYLAPFELREQGIGIRD